MLPVSVTLPEQVFSLTDKPKNMPTILLHNILISPFKNGKIKGHFLFYCNKCHQNIVFYKIDDKFVKYSFITLKSFVWIFGRLRTFNQKFRIRI